MIDFTGTRAQLANNFNAPDGGVHGRGALRVPHAGGRRHPAQRRLPEAAEGDRARRAPCSTRTRRPSVVAGNVETSSCITNALYGALGVMAASQCTMNNFTFGNERHQYYETISGGSGRGAGRQGPGGFDGTSVVQTHMTNSRLTDPEVLEFRFPVRLESYEIRRGSGGRAAGRAATAACGACASSRPMTATILSNGRKARRVRHGGRPARAGRDQPRRAQRRQVEQLDHIGQAEMRPGDVFEIHTPGGGGYGSRK